MESNAKTFTSENNFHLAGIIPVAGRRLEYDLPFPDVLLPIAKDYTLLESAIVECAYAGCDTIWIICNDDTAPLLRYRIGDMIEDPSYYFYNTSKNRDFRKRIPIFWVPQHPKDRDKRDCLAWSVVYGSLVAFQTSSNISKWVIPVKYYVSFPFGVSDPQEVMSIQRTYRTKNNYYMVSEGRKVEDNIHTSFTFGKDEFLVYRRNVRKGTGRYKNFSLDTENKPREELPIEERWSARFFELKDVFKGIPTDSANTLDVKTFYDVSTWEGYLDLMSSDFARNIARPPREMFKYKEFNRVAVDLD